jgi:small subunit ribosomal protein S4
MRRIRKKFKRPKTPWSLASIKEDTELMKEYGLRRKHELLVSREILRGFRRRARDLIAVKDAEKERLLLGKLIKLGMLADGNGLDDVLALNVRNVLDRRLQTIVFRKDMAKSAKQARQIITHDHVSIAGKRTAYPSYLVSAEEEKKVSWSHTSKLKGGLKAPPTAKPKADRTAKEENLNAGEEKTEEGKSEGKKAPEG